MGNEKGKWFQFEEGLLANETLENRLANINRNSYNEFRVKCIDQKLAEKRRAILFFWGTKSGKRKKDKQTNMDDTEKLLIKSIMEACTRSEDGKGELLTVAVVRCEDPYVENAAYIDGKEIEQKKNNILVELEKKVLDNGGRIVEDRRISLCEKYVLIDKDIRDTSKNHIKSFLSIAFNILLKYWAIIIPAIDFAATYLREKAIKPYEYVLIIFCIIYHIIYKRGKKALEKAGERIRCEIGYYKSLGYPVIFYNGTGKIKNWMKNYILKYMEGGNLKGPVFYIGAIDSKLAEKELYKFIIPKGHPEWGLICLCKLVRDLADNPWGENWLGIPIMDKIKDEFVDSSSIDLNKEQNNLDSRIQIFKMPKDIKKLREEIRKKKNWHFARDPSSKDPISRLFPIGNSVYAIRRDISREDFQNEVVELQNTILPGIDVFANPIICYFWLIQVAEKECELMERLNMILSFPIWEEDLWFNIWNSIMQIMENCQNEKINELCETVYNEKKHVYWLSFVDYKKYLENNLKEKVDKDKCDQEELVWQKTKILR